MIAPRERSAWRADELVPHEWTVPVGAAGAGDLAAFCAALDRVASRVRGELFHGLGFVVLDGIPEALLDDAACRADVLFAAGKHIGTPVAQDDGGTLLLDIGGTPAGEFGRTPGYRMGTGLHTDGACGVVRPDVVTFLCVQSAPAGGVSQLVSAWTVLEQLRDRPDVLRVLETPFAFDPSRQQRADARARDSTPIIAWHRDDLDFRYIFYQMSGRGVTAEQHHALAALEDAIRTRAALLQFTLRRGQVLLVDNRHVLHGRTRYDDHDEAALRRHVVRFWLDTSDTTHLTG